MAPNRKVTVGGLAGAVSIIVVWAVRTFGEVEVPPEIASAVTVVLTFVAAYLVSESETTT